MRLQPSAFSFHASQASDCTLVSTPLFIGGTSSTKGLLNARAQGREGARARAATFNQLFIGERSFNLCVLAPSR
ncbi:MAG: hypothetical protein DMF61_18555 [Blastocatellia bacterium AA13]|nr:MAG: hypothetical protein DMF61_18555 [Blastocatellia bacterium AA13]